MLPQLFPSFKPEEKITYKRWKYYLNHKIKSYTIEVNCYSLKLNTWMNIGINWIINESFIIAIKWYEVFCECN